VLLCSVVQIPFDFPALCVSRRGDSCARGAKLLDHRSELNLQATALEGEEHRLTRGAHELRVGAQRPIVDDVGDGLAATNDGARNLTVPDRPGIEGVARAVDEAGGRGIPEGNVERGVIECAGEDRAQMGRMTIHPQLADRILQCAPCEHRRQQDRQEKAVRERPAADRQQPADSRDRICV
jgi:hypothetical protein